MRNAVAVVLVFCVLCAAAVAGCTKKAVNASEAIANAKDMKTVDEQVKYLVGQANAFINSKEFDQAITTAQHILRNLDKDSAQAQSIIEKAKAELQKAAEGALDDVKKKIGSF